MKEIRNTALRGAKLLIGKEKRDTIDVITAMLVGNGFKELFIPLGMTTEFAADFLAKKEYRYRNDIEIFTVREVVEKKTPVAKKLSQFTYLEVSILNPVRYKSEHVKVLAGRLIAIVAHRLPDAIDIKEKNLKDFKIVCDGDVICTGKEYDGHFTFRINIDKIVRPEKE